MAARPGRRRLARGTAQDFLVGTLIGFIVSIALSQTSTLLASPASSHLLPPKLADSTASISSAASASATASTPVNANEPFKQRNMSEVLAARYEPKIACAVTMDTMHKIVPGVIRATWGEDCDQGISFVGPREDVTGETKKFLETPKLDQSWAMVRSLWTLLEPAQAEAVVVSADSSFVVVRNIRHLLRGKPVAPRYMGTVSDKGPFCMHNAYILTRPAVDLLQNELRSATPKRECDASSPDDAGDARLGKCMAALGVAAETLIDSEGKKQIFLQDPVEFFRKQAAYEITSPDCCTKLPVALFNVGKVSNVRTGAFSELYKFDYLIRRTAVAGLEHLRPYNYEDMPSARQIGF